MKIKGRYFARKDLISKIKEDLKRACDEYEALLSDKAKVEVLETELDSKLIVIDGSVSIFETQRGYFPTVRGALLLKNTKRYVTVDRGAVKFVSRGADVMRPGIVDYDPGIKKGDCVVIKEETHGKPLAVGRAMWNGEEFAVRKKGKCVKNVLYVGDEVWSLG